MKAVVTLTEKHSQTLSNIYAVERKKGTKKFLHVGPLKEALMQETKWEIIGIFSEMKEALDYAECVKGEVPSGRISK